MTQQLHSSVGKYEDICPHKKLYADVHSSIAHLTENGKQAECSSSTVEQKNKIWSIHTMEECAIIKWMEYYYSRQHGWILETLWSAKEASHKSPNSVWFHLHEMSGIGKSTEAESRSVVAQGWGDGRENGGNWYGHRASSGGDTHILQLWRMVAHLCDYTESIKLCRVNEWIYNTCELDHNKAVFKKSTPWTAKVRGECSSLKDLMKSSVWTLLVSLAGKKITMKDNCGTIQEIPVWMGC